MHTIFNKREQNLLLEFIEACHAEDSASDFNEITYPKLRELLPHQGFVFGRLDLHNSQLYQYINLGFPTEYLTISSTPQGNIECAMLRYWTNSQRPLYCDEDLCLKSISTELRLQAFIDFGIRNLAMHGVVDNARTTATCYTFSQLEDTGDDRWTAILRVITPHLHTALGPRHAAPPAQLEKPPHKLLTPRERDVLRWLSYGRSSSEIGTLLEISPYTVNVHIQSIIHKLKASNRVHAVAQALRLGVIGL